MMMYPYVHSNRISSFFIQNENIFQMKTTMKILIWIIIEQGPIVLAVGARGGCLDIFFSRLSFLSPFLGDRPI